MTERNYNAKHIAFRFYLVCFIAVCLTAFFGCEAVNKLVDDVESQNPYIVSMSDAYYASLLNEEQVRRNCELLGVDYNCLNMNSDESKEFSASRTKTENDTGGLLTQRYEAAGNVAYVLIEEEDAFFFNIVRDVVNEINYIGKAIDDPYTYEVAYATPELTANNANIVIRWMSLPEINGRYRYRVTYNNKIPFACGDIELSKEHFFTDRRLRFNYQGREYDIDGSMGRDLYDSLTDKPALYYAEFKNPEEISRVIAHELNHAITHQEDMYIKLATTESFSNYTRYQSLQSIMNGGQCFGRTDILLRAAKYSHYVGEKADEYKKFADEYVEFTVNRSMDNIYGFRTQFPPNPAEKLYAEELYKFFDSESGMAMIDEFYESKSHNPAYEINKFDPDTFGGDFAVEYGKKTQVGYNERFTASGRMSYLNDFFHEKMSIVREDRGYKVTKSGVCYYLGKDAFFNEYNLYVFVKESDDLSVYLLSFRGDSAAFAEKQDEPQTEIERQAAELMKSADWSFRRNANGISGEKFAQDVLPGIYAEMAEQYNGRVSE